MSSPNWKENKAWSDKFIDALKRAAGMVAFGVAPCEEDTKHNTDLIVLTGRNVRVACRVRRHEYFVRYPNDFTIRYRLDSGAQTELSKILGGWGDYLIYAFARQDERGLAAWRAIDLDKFRGWYEPNFGQRIGNGDGTHFISFDVRKVAPGIVIYEYP